MGIRHGHASLREGPPPSAPARKALRACCLAALLAPLLHGGLALAQPRYSLTPVRAFYGHAGMNDLGQIVGVTTVQGQGEVLPQATIWTPGADPSITLLGKPYDFANGINNAGQVTGSVRLAPGVDHAAVFSGGRIQDLDTPGGRTSTGMAINARGQVAGFAAVPSGRQHAFLYSEGVMHDLGTLAGGWSYAYGMNDKGQVVGGATVARGHEAPTHAFLYSEGRMTDLSLFAAEQAVASSINNLGQIVGTARVGRAEPRGFLYENGARTNLGTLGGSFSAASSINDQGDIVGYSAIASGEHHAFLVSGGTMTDLNALIDPRDGWTVHSANLINDRGAIAGMACRPHPDSPGAFDCASVLLTPIPEPASRTLWGGALLLGWALHQGRAPRRRALRQALAPPTEG